MRLLRIYPAAWRARYGEEFEALLEELDGVARMSRHDRIDVMRAGVGERLHVFGLAGLPPRERAREGSLLVLWAWTLFVLGGIGVQKASEHWQAVTPPAKQGLPAAAFDVLVVVAGAGSALVQLGVALVLPRLVALIRGGGWAQIRRPIIRAGLLSMLTAAATILLAQWAHSLSPAARNGHDVAYSGAFAVWAIFVAVCLFAWSAAAAATTRRLALSVGLLRVEASLGAAVAVAMAVMTIATAVWWEAVATTAPWFFEGRPVGSNTSVLVANMIAPMLLMLCATSLGAVGSMRALRAIASGARPL